MSLLTHPAAVAVVHLMLRQLLHIVHPLDGAMVKVCGAVRLDAVSLRYAARAQAVRVVVGLPATKRHRCQQRSTVSNVVSNAVDGRLFVARRS